MDESSQKPAGVQFAPELPAPAELPLPDHLHLPDSDGTFVKNFQEHPQSILLTDSLLPVLRRLHPDGQFCIGQDCGIYWRSPRPLEEPTRAAVSPDWYYVPNRPPLLDGRARRSYVLYQELVAPAIVIEFVSGDGSEERDQTPGTGKFWVYEQGIRVPYYAIYEVAHARVEVYHLSDTRYTLMTPNQRGHFTIAPLEVELGIWQGRYANLDLPWLRCWDVNGLLLLTGEERADVQWQRAEQERQRADSERQERERTLEQMARLAAQLRALGVEPEFEPKS